MRDIHEREEQRRGGENSGGAKLRRGERLTFPMRDGGIVERRGQLRAARHGVSAIDDPLVQKRRTVRM